MAPTKPIRRRLFRKDKAGRWRDATSGLFVSESRRTRALATQRAWYARALAEWTQAISGPVWSENEKDADGYKRSVIRLEVPISETMAVDDVIEGKGAALRKAKPYVDQLLALARAKHGPDSTDDKRKRHHFFTMGITVFDLQSGNTMDDHFVGFPHSARLTDAASDAKKRIEAMAEGKTTSGIDARLKRGPSGQLIAVSTPAWIAVNTTIKINSTRKGARKNDRNRKRKARRKNRR